MKRKLLLHICCAPCSTHVIDVLSRDYEVTGFFYNPNIHPDEEYRRRLREAIRYAKIAGVELITGDYDPERWFEAVKGLEGEPEGGRRCRICFEMRLERTAQVARERGFEVFTTTLSVSPHKKADVINEVGRLVAERHGLEFLEADFKKKGGFERSVKLSKQYGLYRQNYCGCIFSLREAEKRRRRRR